VVGQYINTTVQGPYENGNRHGKGELVKIDGEVGLRTLINGTVCEHNLDSISKCNKPIPK